MGPVSDEFEAEGAWIRYDALDLSPMAAVKLLFVMDEAAVGSEVELRGDAPDGRTLTEPFVLTSAEGELTVYEVDLAADRRETMLDFYVVFRRGTAEATSSLLSLEFLPAGAQDRVEDGG